MYVYSQNRGRDNTRGSNSNSRSSSKGGAPSMQYHRCREWGHIRRNCPLVKRKDDGGSEDGSIAVATEVNFGDALTISKGKSSNQHEWILDSGSSNHICSVKEYFVSF